jgi:threonine dehydrogenase-like Zn-dependent dehydrogenase
VKALQLQAVGKLELVDVPVPSIREDQLLIKTRASTICTSDLNDIRSNPFNLRLPVVIGHEGAGVVAAVGKRVTGLRVGDHIAAHPVHPCGRCRNCRSGIGHLCSSMEHFGINLPGTFAEYFVVRQDRARVVPKEMPFTLAALAEPVCVCLEALDQSKVGRGGALLIIGDGPFGILMARLARTRGMSTIVVAGRHDFGSRSPRAPCRSTRRRPPTSLRH